ncbi:hypothetical protein L227DRAFT_289550 [Lentinus tigrinus ALCF2SS1-6]|uniref:Uncharacterized protein n=1 Tax=Lentinus tigrinus ALCF2SS1-6 TaxID=1328759 RepID=A0A5C2RY26_9APHY|nr:hypothetical protein L227DRAFT_289550 [Lentinus tigrinus ALCF2SS1-6]
MSDARHYISRLLQLVAPAYVHRPFSHAPHARPHVLYDAHAHLPSQHRSCISVLPLTSWCLCRCRENGPRILGIHSRVPYTCTNIAAHRTHIHTSRIIMHAFSSPAYSLGSWSRRLCSLFALSVYYLSSLLRWQLGQAARVCTPVLLALSVLL